MPNTTSRNSDPEHVDWSKLNRPFTLRDFYRLLGRLKRANLEKMMFTRLDTLYEVLLDAIPKIDEELPEGDPLSERLMIAGTGPDGQPRSYTIRGQPHIDTNILHPEKVLAYAKSLTANGQPIFAEVQSVDRSDDGFRWVPVWPLDMEGMY
jgi:hypothetical protein